MYFYTVPRVLEGCVLYTELQDLITEYAKGKGKYDAQLTEISRLCERIEGTDINSELMADLVGDYVFNDTEFVKKLYVKSPNIFKRIWNEIKYLCKIASAGSEELRVLEKVRHQFEQVYKEGRFFPSSLRLRRYTGK